MLDRSDPFSAWQTARASIARHGAALREFDRDGREIVECEYPDGSIVILAPRVSFQVRGASVECMAFVCGGWIHVDLAAGIAVALACGVCDAV